MTELRLIEATEKAAEIFGEDVIVESIEITPQMAAQWLKANKHNRPIRSLQVSRLAHEMAAGNWLLNGETIKIAETEDVLDGQHRLLACIESGVSFRTLVVYGVNPKAFSTIDQNVVRSTKDAVVLERPELPRHIAGVVAGAALWSFKLEKGLTTMEARRGLTNPSVLKMIEANPALIRCAETVSSYNCPAAARPLPASAGAGFLHYVSRYGWAKATEFVEAVFLGENLNRTDPVFQFRAFCSADAAKRHKTQAATRMMMMIKTWNATVSGRRMNSYRGLVVTADERVPKVQAPK